MIKGAGKVCPKTKSGLYGKRSSPETESSETFGRGHWFLGGKGTVKGNGHLSINTCRTGDGLSSEMDCSGGLCTKAKREKNKGKLERLKKISKKCLRKKTEKNSSSPL